MRALPGRKRAFRAAPANVIGRNWFSFQSASFMKLLVPASILGEMPHYLCAARMAHASTLRQLLGLVGQEAREIDPVGLRQYFDRRPDGERTCFHAAKMLPAGSDLFHDANLSWHSRKSPEPTGAVL